MMDILIPLAVQTHALIVCVADNEGAFGEGCILANSLNRMLKMSQSRWGGNCPFTVLSMFSNVHALYSNPDEDAEWHHLRRRSAAWKLRHPKLHQMFCNEAFDASKGKKDTDQSSSD